MHRSGFGHQIAKSSQNAANGVHGCGAIFFCLVNRRVAHHGECAIPAIARCLNGLIELRFIFFRLRKGHGKRPRHNVAVIGHRIVKGDGRAGRNPHWHLALQRLGAGCGRRELPICSVMCHIPLPKLAHQRQHFLHIAPAVTLGQSGLHTVKLTLIGPRTQAQIQPPVG